MWCFARFGTICIILKNLKNSHGGVLLIHRCFSRFWNCANDMACNFTNSNTPPWVFFTFFNLYKWYQIAQRNISGSNLYMQFFIQCLKCVIVSSASLLCASLHKKWSFPWRAFSVNVTKSVENCRFGHIYWRKP